MEFAMSKSTLTNPELLWELTASAIAGRPQMRLATPRGSGIQYAAKSARLLTTARPTRPAAVMLFDETSRLHTLALDFDAKTGSNAVERAQSHALDALQLLRSCGFAAWADYSPAGGWHVYAPLATPKALPEVKSLSRALKLRWSTLDTSPLTNPGGGCIRPTGASHATGGYQMLHGTVDELIEILDAGTHDAAWELLCELVPPVPEPANEPALDEPALVIDMGGKRLHPGWETLGATGRAPDRLYSSESEARMALAGAAARAGWQLADYLRAIKTRWSWAKPSYTAKGRKLAEAAGYDFLKAQSNAANFKTDRQSDTSQEINTRGAHSPTVSTGSGIKISMNLQIRKWLTWAVGRGRARSYTPQQQSLLRALALFAIHLDSPWTNVGVRSLALGTGLSHNSIARMLHQFEDDGLIWRTKRGRGIDADTWSLRLNDSAGSPVWNGRIHGLLAVFRMLGGWQVAEVYEDLKRRRQTAVRVEQLALDVGRAKSTVNEALATMSAYGLVERVDDGWIVGNADPDQIAQLLGATELEQIQHGKYVEQRRQWRIYLGQLADDRALSAGILKQHQLINEMDIALELDPPWLDVVDLPPEHSPGQHDQWRESS